jgi:hypothetical protein
MPVTFADRVKLPDDVLISSLQEESVILNLDLLTLVDQIAEQGLIEISN